jgi:putative DNA-invertase from lambdoid prophage Rac
MIYGYARVSTGRMASEGLSLPVQERTINGYCQMHGMDQPTVLVERGISGSVPLGERPQGKTLLALLKRGDVLITPKLDRMFRSARDALVVLDDLKKLGVSLHMIDLGGDVTANGISKLVFTILSAVAEAERDRIRERIAVVKDDQKLRGAYLGGKVPYGYTLVEHGRTPNGKIIWHLEAVADQQETIEVIKSQHAAGQSLRKISANIKQERGETLSIDIIDRIIKG